MTLSRLFVSVLLIPALAMPAAAQHLAPLGLQTSDAVPAAMSGRTLPAGAPRATAQAADPEFSRTRTIIGGVVGGAAGALAGVMIGSETNRDCGGEMCGLPGAAAGLVIGETLGLAIGAHIGARSPHHDRLELTVLSSVGILVGGALLGVGLSSLTGNAAGAIMIPVTPALQLAAAVAIESR